MQIVLYLLAAALAFLGLAFVAGSQGEIMRIVVGVIMWLAAARWSISRACAPRRPPPMWSRRST